jgi:hypothetical protein
MTSPFVIREPSFAEQIQPGVQTLMNALQLHQQGQQFQQALQQKEQDRELERLRLAQQQKNAFTNQVLSFMRQLGPEILEDPSVAERVQQAGLNPKTILKTFQTQQKEQEQLFQAQQDAFVSSLPEELQSGYKSALKGLGAGLGQDAASDLAAKLTAVALTPEQIASLDQQFPEFKDLPVPDKVKAIADIREFQAQLRLGVGPETRRQVQSELDILRLQLQQQRLAITQAKTTPDRLRATLAFLSMVNQQVDDPLTVGLINPELMGKPRTQIIEGLFGKDVLTAYNNAVTFLGEQVPAPQGQQ